MNEGKIKEYLEVIKSQNKYDAEFIDLLVDSYIRNEDGEKIAEKVLDLINKRYDQGQSNKT